MATRLLTRRAPSSSSASKILTLTLGRLLHPFYPLDPIPAAAAAPHSFRSLHSIASHGVISPPVPRSGAHRSSSGPDIAGLASLAPIAGRVPPTSAISGSIGSRKNDHITPCHLYQPLHPRMQTFPCWFCTKARGGSEKHQAGSVLPQINHSARTDKNTGMIPDRSNGEDGKCPRVLAFSPLEGRISGLGSESLKIKRIELSQKLTYALIPALLIISKTKLTTSLLILSVYWQIYGFFKEIFLDYVHQEVTRKWVLIYFQLLLLILAKETFLAFNLE